MKIKLLFLCGALYFLPCFAAGDSDDLAKDTAAAKKCQEWLKTDNRKAVADLVTYPLETDTILPPIKNSQEFLERWDDFFNPENIQILCDSAPAEFGWRGVAIGNGKVWFGNEHITAIHARTKTYENRLRAALKEAENGLHESVRGFDKLYLECSTKKFHIRIQSHGETIKYFSWKKGNSLKNKPDLALSGKIQFSGSAGNEVYDFEKEGYRYSISNPRISEDSRKSLTILRGSKEIYNGICK